MAYTIPTVHTWVDGETPDATLLNEQIKAFMTLALDPPRAKAYPSGAQALTTPGTPYDITFDSEEFNTDNMHSVLSNTERLTIATPGTYLVQASCAFANNATGYRNLVVIKNSTAIARSHGAPSPTTNTTVLQASTLVDLDAGDYLKLQATQNSGGALNTVAGAPYTYLSALWVAR